MRAAAVAVDERTVALANHPNAALYASIARLIPGAGQFLELEPCLVCPAQEKGGEGKGTATAAAAAPAPAESQSQASAGAAGTRAGTAAAAAGAGAGSAPGAGGGRGLVYLNYPLDSIKASTKSTENSMLVGYLLFLARLTPVAFSSLVVHRFLWRAGRRGVPRVCFTRQQSSFRRAPPFVLPLSCTCWLYVSRLFDTCHLVLGDGCLTRRACKTLTKPSTNV